jgi:hypothetical protein
MHGASASSGSGSFGSPSSSGSPSLHRASSVGSFAAAAAERSVRRAPPSHEHLLAATAAMHALCALLTPWGAALLLGPSLLALAAAGGSSASPLACVGAEDVEAAAATACGGEYSALPLLRGAVVCREPFTWSAAMRGKLGDRLTDELRAVSAACAAAGVLGKLAGGARPAPTTANPFGGAAGGAGSSKGWSASLWSAQALQAADAYRAVYGSAASSTAAGPATAAASAKAAPRAAAAASIAAATVLPSPKAPSEVPAQAVVPRASASDDEVAGAASAAVTPAKTAASRPSGAGNPFAFG